MTTVVFLEDNPDLSQEVTVERSDVYAASTTYLRANERITLGQPAAPHAHCLGQRRGARAGASLARRHRGIHRADEREGARARSREHVLRRPVRSQSRQRLVCLRPLPADLVCGVATIGSRRSCGPPTTQVSTNRRTFTIHSTNRLVRGGEVEVMGGKTGFISKAGYCLATLLRLPAEQSQRRGRRARRDVEQRPLLGDAPPVQLAVRQGGRHLRKQDPQSVSAELARVTYSPSASLPRPAAASPLHPPPAAPGASPDARRTP